MNDDVELLHRYVESGSEVAFAAIVERYKGLVYASALRQTRSPDMAEEITQAVFIILARKASTLRRDAILSGWLFRTTCFAARDALKIERRRQRREQEASLMNPDQANLSTDEHALWQEIAPVLDESLLRLDETDRYALLLRFFEQKKLAEVARVLGLSEDGARKRVERALQKLRTLLGQRGVAVPAAILVAVLSANAAPAAPVTLAVATTAATATTASLVKGTLALMTWSKAKIAVVTVFALLFVNSATVVTILLVRGQRSPRQLAAIAMAPETNSFSEDALVMTDFTEAPPDKDGFISLFNGRDLTGWNYNPNVWSVSNGLIVARAPIDSRQTVHVMPWSGGEVDDFELRLQVRTVANCNSGVPVRARWAQHRWFPGYQAEIHGQNTGLLIIAGAGRERKLSRAGWRTIAREENGQDTLESLKPVSDLAKITAARNAVENAEWCDFRVIAQASRFIIHLNGVTVVDTRDEHPTKSVYVGMLGLEYMHKRGTNDAVEFKDIRFRRGVVVADAPH